jgi:DNA repair photolyase
MKRLDNPPNPYESAHREWLEPPPAARVEVYEEQARSILSENQSPDVGFRWSVNPYRGCQHACIYCYARPTHEYLGFGAGSDFETRLVVKTNAPDLLDKAFRSKKWQGESVAMSGVTDCYQPLEAVYGLTRSCLQTCVRFRNPAAIVTKSYLVVRDADLLSELAHVAEAQVLFSIPLADAETARLIEPGAPTPDRRFEAMRRLSEAGVPVGILTAPIIPGLNDGHIPRLLERAAECGAQTAGFVALRLPGSVEPVFLSRLREAMPLRYQRVVHRIRDMRGGSLNESRFGDRMRGKGIYWESIRQLFEVTARRFGLDRPFPAVDVPAPARPRLVQLTLPFGEEETGD